MYYDDLQAHREMAGVRKAELADAANLDRTTVHRIEKHHKSTVETLTRIVNVLNEAYFEARGIALDPKKVVTAKSRYGGE